VSRPTPPEVLFAGPAALVAAAGASVRFGRPKLLDPIDGEPILLRTLRALRAGGAGPLFVAIRPGDRELVSAAGVIPGTGFLAVDGWAEGMAASWRTLSRFCGRKDPFVLAAPGDLPWLRAETVRRIVAEAASRPGRMIVPCHGGAPGHPVALPAPLLERGEELRGDQGFRRWRSSAELIEVDDPGVGSDVDSPGDLPDRPV
jgi:CTP:molybdopterin cytidylyltransferase MocA